MTPAEPCASRMPTHLSVMEEAGPPSEVVRCPKCGGVADALELGHGPGSYSAAYCAVCDAVIRELAVVPVRRPDEPAPVSLPSGRAEFPRCSADRHDLEDVAS